MAYRARIESEFKSRQIARSLIQAILSGELPPNSFLPAEKTMAEQYGVSVDTLRRALRYLRQLQFIRTLNGKGSQICDPDLNCFDPLASPASKRNSLTVSVRPAAALPDQCSSGAERWKTTGFSTTENHCSPHPAIPESAGRIDRLAGRSANLPLDERHCESDFPISLCRRSLPLSCPQAARRRLSPDYPSDLEQVLTAMEQGQISEFAHAVYHSLQRLLDSSLDYLIQQGVGEAKRLRLPDVLPGVFLEEECECHSRSAEESFPISFPDGKIRRRS